MFDDNEISCSEFSIINCLYEGEIENQKMNITELASSLKITKSAASQLVTRLEKKGYIKRKINLFDKKINYISLNENAMKQYEDKHNEYINAINKVREEMGEKDIKELTRLLEKLSNIINDLGKDDCVC